MIKKTELKLKELTTNDIANIVETISDYIVGRDENGSVYYMPYLRKNAMAIALTLYAIDGIKFEDNDNIFDIYTEDEDINALVKLFMNDNLELISEIKTYVDDVVTFKKNYIIHNNHILTNKIMDIFDAQKTIEDYNYELAKKQNRILDQNIEANEHQLEVMKHLTPEEIAELDKKVISGEYDQKKIADAVVKSYMDSGLIDKDNVVSISKKRKSSSVSTSKTKKSTKSEKETKPDSNK